MRLLGRVTDPDLAVLLDRATALVVPSRAEGFGLPLLEAMAVGTPVVTSDASALVEVGGGAARVSPLDPPALAQALADVVGDEGAAGPDGGRWTRPGRRVRLGQRRAAAVDGGARRPGRLTRTP